MSNYYNDFHNFADSELRCKCCGKYNDNPEFIELMTHVQQLRTNLGFPIGVSSAYRCPNHPIEAKKTKAGQHSIAAIDLRVHGERAWQLLTEATSMGVFTGIGISQKGDRASRFIHLDLRQKPTIWSY